jgi:hypothetical protein
VIVVVEFSFLDQIPLNLDDVKNMLVGLFFPPTIFVFPPKKETIYCEESKHRRKRTKKEHSGDERNRRDNVNTEAPFCVPPRNAGEMS